MRRIRTAVEWIKDKYGVEHPLAELDLETDGRDVFFRESGFLVSASLRGQIAINEILSRYLQRIERDPNRIPVRFYPLTYDASPKTIVMTLAGKIRRVVDEKGLDLAAVDLMSFKGVGEAKALLILAAIEFVRRRNELPRRKQRGINCLSSASFRA